MKSTLTTLALALAACGAQAGTFDAWTLNGSAALRDAGDTLRLTGTNEYQAGSAWAPGKVSLQADFSVAFSFRLADGTAADGITFTVQNSAAGASALGADGGFLGYQNVATSVAFVYDTFDNGFEVDRVGGHNTSVASSGNLVNGWNGNSVGTAYTLRDKVVYSWVDYSAATGVFNMYISDTDVKPLTAQETISLFQNDLVFSQDAYVGFTGATGGAFDNQDILSVSISAVPEPGSLALGLAGLPLLAAFARARRRG